MIEKESTYKNKIEQLTRKVKSLDKTVSDFKKSEQLFTVAVESAPIGMLTLAMDGQIGTVNKAFCQMLGYTKKELLTLNISQITHNEDLQIGLDVIEKLNTGKGKNATFEKRYIHKKGHEIYAQVSTALLRDQLSDQKKLFTQVINISQQKKHEANLVKSENKYKTLVNSVRDVIIVIQDDIIKFANQRTVSLYGKPLNKIIGQPLLKFVHPKSIKMITNRYTDWRNGKNVPNFFELSLVNSKNEKVEFEVRSSAVNYEGKPSELVIMHDITNRIVAKEALQSSESKYKNLVEKSGIAIVIDDKQGNITHYNTHFAKLFGYSMREIKNQNIRKIIYSGDVQKVFKIHDDRLSGKYVSDRYEFRGIKKDGSVIYLETDTQELRDGELIIGTQSYLWDITERVLSEEALLNSEQNFRLLAENSIDCIWTMDKKLNFTYLSPAIKKILGFEPHEWIGTNLSSHFKKKEFLQASAHATKAIKNYRTFGSINFETKMLDIHNKEIDVEISGKALLNIKGRLIGLQGITRAITERKRTEIEIFEKSKELSNHYKESEQQRVATISVLSDLNSTTKKLQSEINVRKKSERELKDYRNQLEELVSLRTAKLEEANKELEAFSYSVSHDLRAPLRAIDGFTRILIEDYASKLDKEGNRLGSIIQRNAQKMGHLIDDLLAFSRLGRATMTITKIDMAKIVNNIYQEATNEEMRKRIRFSISDLPQLNADAKMMRQVWVNLISNAIKFSSYRKRAFISITGKEEKDKLTYCIKDNGAGFDMKYGDKLFGVFQRLHGENEFEGTGVGLALIHRIIKRYDGDVWAEGKVDKGASFYFSLPKIMKVK